MMFADSDSDEFAAYGIGAMAWEHYRVGMSFQHWRLIAIVPFGEDGSEWIQIYPMHAPNNWAAHGDVNGWDGNWEAPTFDPSIDCSRGGAVPGGWHGYIVEGKVCDTQKCPVRQEERP